MTDKLDPITITEVLTTLKLLDKRIAKLSNQLTFHAVETANGRFSVGNESYPSLEKAEAAIKTAYNRVTSLLARRARLKGRLTLSNAVTKVYVGGKDISVAEAIEMKSSITSQLTIENRLSKSITLAARVVEDSERRIATLTDRRVSQIMDNKKSLDAGDDTVSIIEKAVRKSEEVKVHDPLKATELLENLQERIQDFLGSIDTRLTISNSVTFVDAD